MIAYIHHRCPADHLAEILTVVGMHHIQVTVQENCAVAAGAAERKLTPEVTGAVDVNSVAVERIVGALRMASDEHDPLGSTEVAEVEPCHKAHVLSVDSVALSHRDLSLGDGIEPLLEIQGRVAGVHQVDVAVVAQGEIPDLEVIPYELNHSEVAVGTLALPASRCKDNVLSVIAHSENMQALALDSESERSH